jgi:hypothetical protein
MQKILMSIGTQPTSRRWAHAIACNKVRRGSCADLEQDNGNRCLVLVVGGLIRLSFHMYNRCRDFFPRGRRITNSVSALTYWRRSLQAT